MNDSLSVIKPPGTDNSNLYNYDLSNTNSEIEDMVGREFKRAKELLLSNKEVFIDIVGTLVKNEKMEPEEFQAIAAKGGIDAAIVSPKITLYGDYQEWYQNWKKAL